MYSFFPIVALVCLGAQGLPNESPVEKTILSACIGSSVSFPWGFGSTPDQISSQQLIWVFGDTEPPTTLATYSADTGFSASPAYSKRVSLSKDGRDVTLRGLTPRDAGRYTLMARGAPGPPQPGPPAAPTVVRRLVLTVDGLVSSDGNLHVQMGSKALWESNSSQWMIRLSCGNFSFTDSPPFDVIWTTPTGRTLPSSDPFSQGRFHLRLLPPVPAGRYTCRLPQAHFPAACAPSGGGPQGDGKLEGSVLVDPTLARLLVVESALDAAQEETRSLRANQTQLTQEMEVAEEGRRAEREEQEEGLRQLREEVEAGKEEMRSLREEMAEMGRLKEEMAEMRQRDADSGEARQEVGAKLGWLTERVDLLSTNVAFMTRMSRDAYLGANQRVRLDSVVYNAGDAYKASSGEFTAPISGTYLFFMKTESAPRKETTLGVIANGHRVLYLYGYDDKWYQTPGGSVVVHLRQGQRVWVSTTWAQRSLVRTWTIFGGLLVRPDFSD